MAWNSTGRSNAELVRNMHRSGLIKSEKVLKAFQAIDRGHFVPPDARDHAYKDEPVRSGSFHLSAPHMYATVLEALELSEGLSFLNVGSGSGYLSFLVAIIVGGAVNHGIEQHKEVVDHARSRCAKVPELQSINHIRFRLGDAFSLKTDTGLRYDRIYIGAGCHLNATLLFKELLAVGGMMVAPVEDELVCFTRAAENVFVSKVITGVSFQSLVEVDERTSRLRGKTDLTADENSLVTVSNNGLSIARVVRYTT